MIPTLGGLSLGRGVGIRYTILISLAQENKKNNYTKLDWGIHLYKGHIIGRQGGNRKINDLESK